MAFLDLVQAWPWCPWSCPFRSCASEKHDVLCRHGRAEAYLTKREEVFFFRMFRGPFENDVLSHLVHTRGEGDEPE